MEEYKQPNQAKFTPIKRKAYLELLEKGGRRVASANSIGLHYGSIRNYLKHCPEFQDEIDQAEMDACEGVENKLFELALSGHFASIVFWLLNRSKGRWRDHRNPAIIIPKDERPKEKSKDDVVKELEAMLTAAKTSKKTNDQLEIEE